MKLIVQPADGITPILAAIKRAKTSVEIAIFRFDCKDLEAALKAAAARGVRVTALIAFANRGGAKNLRKLELRFLEAGIIVARTSDDLARYHGKYMLIDRRTLYVLSFNLTGLDIDRSRGFGIVTSRAPWLKEAIRLFKADCTRTAYAPKINTFIVSPANSRQMIGTFLKRAKSQLLIYDPKISDKQMLHILDERSKAGVEIKVIGQVAGRNAFESQKLAGRLHTRTIIRDRRQAFVGSQSLRTAELDLRREVGLIIHDAGIVKTILATFESDWTREGAKIELAARKARAKSADEPKASSRKNVKVAVKIFAKELEPLATTVKKAVRRAVAKAGEDVLHDKDVKATMKKVVKQAVKEAVKDAVNAAEKAGR